MRGGAGGAVAAGRWSAMGASAAGGLKTSRPSKRAPLRAVNSPVVSVPLTTVPGKSSVWPRTVTASAAWPCRAAWAAVMGPWICPVAERVSRPATRSPPVTRPAISASPGVWRSPVSVAPAGITVGGGVGEGVGMTGSVGGLVSGGFIGPGVVRTRECRVLATPPDRR